MAFRLRPNPHLYEVNARIFLERLSRGNPRPLSLSTVPEEIWRGMARRGFDLVWLMGVWQRSPAARRAALDHPDLRGAYDESLPGWSESDVGASPYAIFDYVLDRSLGESAELAVVRASLNREGLGLILDFVPNHLAMDHPWVVSHPDRFVSGSEAGIREHPDWYFTSDGTIFLAHGRDPNFPPWTDTVQVNFFSPELRDGLLGELLRIAETADGVRCDMAMLGLNDVFGRVWGLPDPPAVEFWSEIIGGVRRAFPGFLFIGEAYWGLEQALLRLGFDFVYDKAFYDKLRWGSAREIREHLGSFDGSRSVRFIENHDEPRAASAFGRERLGAATAILATVPGLRLFHDGQLEGRRVRLPVQLQREPEEPADPEVSRMLERILQITSAPAYHEGIWTPMETGNDVLAWSWRLDRELKIVLVNYAPDGALARVSAPAPAGGGWDPVVRDEMTGSVDRLEGVLEVVIGPWEARLLDLSMGESSS